MQVTTHVSDKGLGWFRRAGPYLLLELLLPGGTLLALLLWFSSGLSRGQFAEAQQQSMAPVAVECVVRK
jgi:hypothetical protein